MYSQYCTKPFFKKPGTVSLKHSAKGSTWKEHKYIKRINDTYYYPENYAGGRHLPDGEKKEEKDPTEEEKKEQSLRERTRVFDEFESVAAEMAKKGEIEWDPEKVSNMSKEELGELYKKVTGVSLEDRDLTRLYNSREAKKNPESEEYEPMLSSGDIDNLAKEVIKGLYGEGDTRKELLAENYEDVMKRVNELQKSAKRKVSSASEEDMSKLDETVKNASSKKTNSSVKSGKGLDMDKIYSVYERRQKRQNWTK